MNARTRWLLSGALGLGIVGAGVGIGLAETGVESDEQTTDAEEAEGSDSDEQLTGTDRELAEAAALEAVGGGTVTEVEIGDDGAAYGVEIRGDDGTQVEVLLDDAFSVIGTEADDD